MKAGWQQTTLGSVAQVGAGNPAPQGGALFADGIHPFFRTSDAGRVRFGDITESSDYLNDEGVKGLRRFPAGTILFPKSGASTFLNHRVMLGVDGYVSSHLATIVGDETKVDRRFLLYFLSTVSAQDLIQDHAYPSLNLPLITGIPVPLPPLPEQHRIVDILDEAFDGIATAKASAEQNLQNARALFESHLQSVFTERGAGWVDRTLDKVCIVERGSSPRPIKSYFTTAADGVNWIKIGDTEEGGKYVFSTAQKITPEGAKQSRYVKEGDFILTNSMSLGRPYIMKTNGYIHDGWFVLRLGDGIDSEFFYYLLSSSYVQAQFHTLAAGAVVKNISGDLVKKAVLPIPPLAQQHDLAERFFEFSEETQRLETLYRQKLTALDDLKKSLLHRAFSGQL
ncbi:MAG: restriction endonuclease subunit S [Rhodocyclaceae bacterium]